MFVKFYTHKKRIPIPSSRVDWNSFLSYIPFTVLAAMTVPAMFYATDNRLSGIAAFFAAAAAAILGRGLVIVACAATAAVLFMDGVIL